MPQPKPVSLRLTADEIAALNKIAARVNSVAGTSQNVGNESWRTLIRDIASGKVQVYRP